MLTSTRRFDSASAGSSASDASLLVAFLLMVVVAVRTNTQSSSPCNGFDMQKCFYNSASAYLTLLSKARSVDEDGAARVAKDLAANAAVMSPPKRRELGRAGVTARRDMV